MREMGRTLFIDYDGTLHDTDSRFQARLDGLYGLTGEQVVEAYLAAHRRIVHRQYPEKHDDFFFHQRLISDYLKRPYDEQEARRAAQTFEEAQRERWTNPSFFPDTFVFLDRVRQRHILCLTTGDYAREKADALEKAAGKSYFSYAFDHSELGVKGDRDFFLGALMSTNARPENAVSIGDSLEQDISAAREAGILAVWVNRKGRPLPEHCPTPDFQAGNLLEVLDYLDSL